MPSGGGGAGRGEVKRVWGGDDMLVIGHLVRNWQTSVWGSGGWEPAVGDCGVGNYVFGGAGPSRSVQIAPPVRRMRRARSSWQAMVSRERTGKVNPPHLSAISTMHANLSVEERAELVDSTMVQSPRLPRPRVQALRSEDTPWAIGGCGYPIRPELLTDVARSIGEHSNAWCQDASGLIAGDDEDADVPSPSEPCWRRFWFGLLPR